jgi:hypothetical protein
LGSTGKKNHSIRCVFIASREKLSNNHLVPLV